MYKRPENAILAPGDREIAIQWYQSAFDEQSDDVTKEDRCIAVLYATNIKPKESDMGVPSPGLTWVQHNNVVDVHDRYVLDLSISSDLFRGLPC